MGDVRLLDMGKNTLQFFRENILKAPEPKRFIGLSRYRLVAKHGLYDILNIDPMHDSDS